MRSTLAASVAGVVAALLGGLCCAGPLAFVALGVGAGLAGRFEPLRPVFAVIAFGAFTLAYRTVYGRPTASSAPARNGAASGATTSAVDGARAADNGTCTTRPRRRDRVIFWTAAAFALLLWSSPAWSGLFF